jgi:probable phosphoglycerate mutase
VSQRIEIDLQQREFLMERDVGELSGLTGDEIGDKFPAWREHRYLTNAQEIVPEYEGDEAFNERVIPNFVRLIEAHVDEEIAVVTHGGVIGAFCRHVLGITKRRSANIDNASLTTFTIRDAFADVQLIRLNDTCHLRQ